MITLTNTAQLWLIGGFLVHVLQYAWHGLLHKLGLSACTRIITKLMVRRDVLVIFRFINIVLQT